MKSKNLLHMEAKETLFHWVRAEFHVFSLLIAQELLQSYLYSITQKDLIDITHSENYFFKWGSKTKNKSLYCKSIQYNCTTTFLLVFIARCAQLGLQPLPLEAHSFLMTWLQA